MQDAKIIKQNLENLIQNLDPSSWAKNPNDFTRNRKLGFNKLIRFLLCMRGNTINKEIYDYFNKEELMSKSAFVQQRNKLKPECLYYLFNEFNRISEDNDVFEGYKLYAFDGSDINIAYNPDDESTFIKTKLTGYNQLHLNAMYDLLNKTYVDCDIQDIHNTQEVRSAIKMINRNCFDKTIIIADRGYGSLNLLETIKRRPNTEYLIRVKNDYLKEIKALPMEELDTVIKFQLRTTQTKEDKKLFAEGKAKWITGPSKFGKYKKDVTWDFESPCDVSLRVVRFKITDDTYETIVTSLNRFQFNIEKIKYLYHLRWGIETSFRELKYTIGLVNFHSKKKEYIIQEIYSRLIMYNFSQRITKQVVIKNKETEYIYKVNFTMSAHICFDYFRYRGNKPPDVNNLISKYIEPIREGRADERKLKPKSAVFFLYRVA